MTSRERLSCQAFLAVLVLSALNLVLPQWCAAQSLTSTWESLPEETVVALRIPDGKAVAEAFIRDTKFGAVMFSEQKKAAVLNVLETENSEGWSEFQTQLKAYDLTTDDLLHLFSGESGYAVVMNVDNVDDGQKPVFSGLGWLEPGEELAAKVYAAIAKTIDEQDDAEHPVTRVDLTLADYPVMQLRVPSVSTEYDKDAYDLDEDYGNLSEEEQEEAYERATKNWRESAVEKVSYHTILVSTLGNRLLVAHSFQSQTEDEGVAEQLGAMFGQLLAAHASGGGDFVARMADDPGVARVMGLEGLPTFEMLGDVAPFVKLLQSNEVSSEKSAIVVRLLGLEGLGPFAGRSTIEGMQSNTQFSFSVPAPRRGLMQLLDQETLAVDPPAWVPASAVRYYQLSFDLGKAYEIIKEEVLRAFPEQAAGGFMMAETYTQGFAKASLPEVLSSLGNRHTIMSFGVEPKDEVTDNFDDDDDDDDDDERSVKVRVGVSSKDRMAIVWQIEDEELWGRLLKGLTPFAKMSEGLEFSEEQGFSGWRMKKEQAEGGLFLGKGYLVLAYGSGVLESMLSSLNNPPTGADSLRGSKVFAKASEMLNLEPSLVAEITDGDRYMSMVIGTLKKQLKQISKLMDRANEDGDDEGSSGKLMLSLAKVILPNEKEMQGMMGVIVGRWEVNEHGLFMSTAQEIPRP